MITPAYVQTMATYNAEMNRRWYAAAGRLTDAQRREAKGAYWSSIHGSLNHILWGDMMWMSRFAGWPKPDIAINDSPKVIEDFVELSEKRVRIDIDLSAWAGTVDEAWLAEDLVWVSGAMKREMKSPRALLVTHLFNHQTHHRGQVHCLLSQFGQDTGATDLPFYKL